MSPSIEEVKALQLFIKKPDYHVVFFDANGFVIAHTDYERSKVSGDWQLTDCDLHIRLSLAEIMPVDHEGYYMWLPAYDTFWWLGPAYMEFPV